MQDGLNAAILEALPMPVLIVDRQERVTVANAASRQIFGEAVQGRNFATVLRQPALMAALEAALRRGEQGRVRSLIQGSGRELVAMVSCAPIGSGAMLSFEDVTALEEAEAMRRDFVANVSHELRTPLTALMGFIETLRGAARDDPAARERFLSIMDREANRMNRLVADLLSLSRVEAEERKRPAQRVDVVSLVQSALVTLRPQAEAAGVNLLLEGGEDAIVIPADPDQLTQVFTNLIENAVKYGGGGGEVKARISRIPHEAGLRGPAVKIMVSDKGDGIDPLHLPRLTERFYRVDTHRSREQGGTGLGLAIVKHIVNRHRGRLRIESQKGQGSSFIVTLPES